MAANPRRLNGQLNAAGPCNRPAHYGVTERLEGAPALLVIDPRTDRLLDPGRVSALQDARHMTPQALADWLAQWTN